LPSHHGFYPNRPIPALDSFEIIIQVPLAEHWEFEQGVILHKCPVKFSYIQLIVDLYQILYDIQCSIFLVFLPQVLHFFIRNSFFN
jgi:hypothetical protein